jgi:pimeloyl-ACP methyl ester carboxylesterase
VKALLSACLSVGFAISPFAASSLAAQGAVFQTSVTPLRDEDLASDCRYEITLTDRERTIRGVWVIFDRGRDMLRIYTDPDVQAFAQRHDLALLFPFHCRAKSGTDGDLNMDPAKGIGRALFAALDQFAELSGHRELASAKLILLGFSGTGSLVGRFAAYAPDRVLAVVATHPGHNPLGLETIDLPPEATAIPQFILAGSTDRITGTERPYAYFRKYFERGAPWTFVVQNKTPHCCVINAKALVLMWLDAVVVQRMTRGSDAERYGFIRTAPETVQGCPNLSPPAVPVWCHGTKDAWGGENWSVSTAAIEPRPSPPREMIPAGWLPTASFAKEWLSFVTQPDHAVMSLP